MGGTVYFMTKGYLTINCADKQVIDFEEYRKSVSQKEDVLYDDRHQLFSEDNTNDMVEYLNYIDTIKEIAQKNTNTGKYRYMLDLGFIPICMPPGWMILPIYMTIRPALEARGIEYFQLPASSFSLGAYTGSQPDIWVHKLSVHELCNCKPELVTVRRLVEVLGLC